MEAVILFINVPVNVKEFDPPKAVLAVFTIVLSELIEAKDGILEELYVNPDVPEH